MPYLLLIMEPHGQRAERGLAGGQEAYARMQRYGQDCRPVACCAPASHWPRPNRP